MNLSDIKKHKKEIGFMAGGLLLGLWVGINFGKGSPIFVNPFADPQITHRIQRSGEEVIDASGGLLKKGWQLLTD